jgi:hypothetical protein
LIPQLVSFAGIECTIVMRRSERGAVSHALKLVDERR